MKLFDFKQKVDYKTEILAGLTVAMTMIPESLSFALLAGFPPLVNLNAGARSRLSGIIAGITILVIILVGAPIIELLPIAALTGVMIVVAFTTFEWTSFKAIKRMPKSDILVMLVVTLVTLFFHNLALAVLIGVIISALVFAWESAKKIRARKFTDTQGIKHYAIFGPLFFGSTTSFLEKFDIHNDPSEIIIDFSESRVSDMSAINALHNITQKYAQLNKKVSLYNLSEECKNLLEKAGNMAQIQIHEEPFEKIMR